MITFIVTPEFTTQTVSTSTHVALMASARAEGMTWMTSTIGMLTHRTAAITPAWACSTSLHPPHIFILATDIYFVRSPIDRLLRFPARRKHCCPVSNYSCHLICSRFGVVVASIVHADTAYRVEL
jgi:hypothetical protein